LVQYKRNVTVWVVVASNFRYISTGRGLCLDVAKGCQKQAQNTDSEPRKIWSTHFRTNLTSFDHANEGSRLQIWVLFTRSKIFFWGLVLVRDQQVPKNGFWMTSGLVPNFFLTFFRLDGFEFWIAISWCVMCLDSCQSIS